MVELWFNNVRPGIGEGASLPVITVPLTASHIGHQ